MPEFEFDDGPLVFGGTLKCKFCKECIDRIKARSAAERDAKNREERIKQLGTVADPVWRRAQMMRFAAVKWRDRAKIREVYIEAKRKTEETGVPHDVDHIYPLQGAYCCGLHVHNNLRVIPATENRSKNNAMPLTHSPALRKARAS